jgi:superfamily II DNA or RNA helicase
MTSLTWDDGPPWQFRLQVYSTGQQFVLRGNLQRDGETMPLNEPALMLAEGLVIARSRIASLEHGGSDSWLSLLRKAGEIEVPASDGLDLVQEVLAQSLLPPVDWPEQLRFEEIAVAPRCCLKLRKPEISWRHQRDILWAGLVFDYEGNAVGETQPGSGVYEPRQRRFWRRDLASEQKAVQRLHQAGFKKYTDYYFRDQHPGWECSSKKLPKLIRELVCEGWHIESEGRLFRNANGFRAELSSGIDWFELRGGVDFGSEQMELPDLLRALEKGEDLVRLSDGSYGMLPSELLEKWGVLIRLGKKEGGHLRYSRAQTGLLDLLLAGQEEVRVDELFQRARAELQQFNGIQPAEQPEGFVGRLRDYQLEGLAWMQFLRQFRFGGCLADDMGVGKTAQVLALLETRRVLRNGAANGHAENRPSASLAVVPRSLVYNWKREAERFTPALRVLDYTGAGRQKNSGTFDQYDLILTTYGTLRRDAADFQAVRFDYIILDEAQAIKNAASESAKAARLLRGDHRLALSGTPVENHLGELWSLFEFLNPGMLGGAAVFQMAGETLRKPDEETQQVLARAVRPFILRRTKDQVARELPSKIEQTLYCELDAQQRKLYNELRDHYRGSLLGRIERQGMARSQMQILEALLRLRQAACHPGLIDPKRAGESSAKLEALLPQIAEVIEEGHKVLVFSQFTSLLAIVRKQLDADRVAYEYLDGRTRDREAAVDRFQKDPACRLFLVSLKAGGVGLNLSAAEYVFLLDPWWNPAVEAQAIDRAHRIGQTKTVFAYRLIARETVEEKVVELQKSKRDLADAIIRADTRLVRNLNRDDLQLLLS